MSIPNPQRGGAAAVLKLQFPQSLAVYDDYASAQKSVDYLSDHDFPVQNCMIVGTELKQIERITGRLSTGKVALASAMSGAWFGLFVGLIMSLFSVDSWFQLLLTTVLFGALFGLIMGLIGYAMTRGQRDFSSVSQVVATKYEVLVEHKVAGQARELLAGLPGALPNRFE